MRLIRYQRSVLPALLLLCCFFIPVKSQAENDSLAVKKLIEQGDKLIDTDPGEARRIFDKAKKLSDNDELRLYYAQALYKESFLLLQETRYREGIDYSSKAAEIFHVYGKKSEEARCYSRIGLVWQYLNDYEKSLHYLFRGLKIAEDLNDLKLKGAFYTNIGLAYETLEDWGNTLAYAQKSLEIKKQTSDTPGMARTYSNIANAYYYQKQDSAAVEYLRLALDVGRFSGDSATFSNTLLALGNLYVDQNQYDSAHYYISAALAYYESHKEQLFANYCVTLMGFGYNQLKRNYLKDAGRILDKCMECEAEIEDFSYKKHLYRFRYEYYKKTGNIVAALSSLELMYKASDSLYQQSKNFENQRIAIRYEFDRKVIQDSLKYQLSLADQQKATAEYRSRMYLLAVVALLIAGIAGFFYTRSNINRKKQLIAQQQTQLAEGKALRAQMNPHFIFNCLNTIDAFVLQNKQQDASMLIQRFSKLSRRILEYTSENYVTLRQELETLSIYLQIEQVRKNHQFSYTIDADPEALEYLIPPMLLQPFVENAVLHGMQGITNGDIHINVAKDNKYILIKIEDSGIGRAKAAALKNAQPETHKSLSMDLTLLRLETLHGHKRKEEYIRFTDLTPPQQGTRVEIIIPLKTENNAESHYTG